LWILLKYGVNKNAPFIINYFSPIIKNRDIAYSTARGFAFENIALNIL
jgi:hypothetical protein